MPIYESVIVGRQDITKNQFDKLIEEFSSIITEQKGTIKKTELMNKYKEIENVATNIHKTIKKK